MKKKIALLLAAVMMFAAAVPMSLFANTTVKVSNTYPSVGEEVVIVNNPALAAHDYDDVAARAKGTDIIFTYTTAADIYGGQFDLILDNAQWLYEAEWSYKTTTTKLDDNGDLIVDEEGKAVQFPITVTDTAFNPALGNLFESNEGYLYYTNVKSYQKIVGGVAETIVVDSVAKLLDAASTIEARGKAAVWTLYDNTDSLGRQDKTPFYAKYDPNRTYQTLTVVVLNSPVTGDTLSVPLIFLTWDDANVTVINDITSSGQVSGISKMGNPITLVDVTGVGTFSTTVIESREKFNLGDITIMESKAGVAGSGTLILEAPDGYAFVNSSANPVGVRNGVTGFPSASVTFSIPTSGTVLYPNASKAVTYYTGQFMIVNLDLGATTASSARRTIYLTGVRLAVSDDAYAAFNQTANINIYDAGVLKLDNAIVSGGRTNFTSTTTPYSLPAVKRIEYGVKFETTSSTINEIYAGAARSASNSIVWNERSLNSLLGNNDDTRFELVDENGNSLTGLVKITDAFISSVYYFKGLSVTPTNTLITGQSNTGFKVYDNYILMAGNGITTDRKGSLTFRLGLTARADFAGDVYLKATGRSIPSGEAQEPILIATVLAPLEVSTTTSEVEVGYQAIKVSKVVITEADANLFDLGGVITLEMDTYGYNNYISFSNLGAITVNYTGDGILDRIVASSGKLTLTVTRASRSTPFEITIDGIHVDVNRSVPEGKYDLVVGGDAFVHNYNATAPVVNTDKTFLTSGLVVPSYVKVVTPGSNQALSKNVAVSLENPSVAIVDGTTNYDISAAPAYIDPVTNRTMFSIKYIAMALGISESEVKWDGVARTVTIYTNSRSTVTMFYIDKDFYTINSGVQNMVDDNGVHAYSVISNERSYIPMKYLAEAFGLTAIWNPTTRTAYFNPTEAQKVDCALANAGE